VTPGGPPSVLAPRSWRSHAGGVAAALGLALAMTWLWGFTVDDALISCRVAWNLARGAGYRFNPDGPIVDAVTPLGFAYLLAPFASGGPMAALAAAKWLGALSVVAAAFVLGQRVLARCSTAYGLGLVATLSLTAPLAAWAVSGMETGLVTALCVLALGRGWAADVAAALAAAWRPELTPWACVLRAGLRLEAGASFSRALSSPCVVLSAVALTALVRTMCFGRAAPLAVFAKPSDLAHGVSYALHAFVQSGLPWLCVAPFSLRKGAPVARAITLAGLAHFASLALAGGDWMSLYRLAVPVLPSFALGAAELWRVAPSWASWARLGVAAAMSAYLNVAVGPVARGVGPERAALIESARPHLLGARVVAALDVGWVGAAGDYSVLDLAGVTDEAVAVLPGGHTSKRVSDALLRGRDVDALVLLEARAQRTGFDREVERRVALMPSAESMSVVARLPLAGARQHYVILRAQPTR
jgi:hypothetical protein